ncbi:PIN domain-containing protein [Marinomonas mediterranea]|uniref:PIN domain-containing protein n=1 Tax=Marinomonas mediterranea TaxID=119864 RepID=UPI002349ED42|nr:PIN domain-containing protein [Marinomonas mediterranea]WCN08170.1 PIN domain-containing protein [Marinomonas mediterranea]
MNTYTVILDACVLYPAPLRSYLMYLASTGLFRARWSDQIHEEWIRNLLINRPTINPAALQRSRELMDSHVPDALVQGHEALIDGLRLPDMGDRHVLAAAIQGHAEGIITFNLKDFPNENLAPFGISALHPDEFLSDMFELDSAACLLAAQRHRKSLKNPPFNSDEYLECLLKQKLPSFVSDLRKLSFAL